MLRALKNLRFSRAAGLVSSIFTFVRVHHTRCHCVHYAAAHSHAMLGSTAGCQQVLRHMQETQHTHELHPIHRLDAGTEGVTVLAKTPDFARYMSTFMGSQAAAHSAAAPGGLLDGAHEGTKQRTLQKTYRALAPVQAPIGALEHWAVVNSRAGGQPAYTHIVPSQEARAVYCALTVEAVCLSFVLEKHSNARVCFAASA